MANKQKSSGSWKKERASMTTPGARSTSNKYRPKPADRSKRPASGDTQRYWRAGYTRKDGVKVKGHYVNRSS